MTNNQRYLRWINCEFFFKRRHFSRQLFLRRRQRPPGRQRRPSRLRPHLPVGNPAALSAQHDQHRRCFNQRNSHPFPSISHSFSHRFQQVSTPDEHGFCSFGPSVDVTRSAVKNAKYIIAQINAKIPRTFGDGMIHRSHIDCMVPVDQELPVRLPSRSNPTEKAIATIIADHLVENGATLQMGRSLTWK